MVKSNDELSFIQWKNLKNIEDRTVYAYGLIVQKMRTEVTRLINAIGQQAAVTPLRQSNFVSLVMLFRIREYMLSIELLVSKGLAHDAAVLILALMRLRMEMQYITLDTMNADEWIQRKKQSATPWDIEKLTTELCPDPEERNTEKMNREFFEKLQHADPMRNQPDFPIKEDEIATASRDELAICLFCAGSECYRILKAAAADLSDAGFKIKKSEAAIEELYTLNKELQALQKQAPKKSGGKYYPGA